MASIVASSLLLSTTTTTTTTTRKEERNCGSSNNNKHHKKSLYFLVHLDLNKMRNRNRKMNHIVSLKLSLDILQTHHTRDGD